MMSVDDETREEAVERKGYPYEVPDILKGPRTPLSATGAAIERCSCEESVALRAEVASLRDKNAKDRLDDDAVAYLAECEEKAEVYRKALEGIRVLLRGCYERTATIEGINALTVKALSPKVPE